MNAINYGDDLEHKIRSNVEKLSSLEKKLQKEYCENLIREISILRIRIECQTNRMQQYQSRDCKDRILRMQPECSVLR